MPSLAYIVVAMADERADSVQGGQGGLRDDAFGEAESLPPASHSQRAAPSASRSGSRSERVTAYV